MRFRSLVMHCIALAFAFSAFACKDEGKNAPPQGTPPPPSIPPSTSGAGASSSACDPSAVGIVDTRTAAVLPASVAGFCVRKDAELQAWGEGTSKDVKDLTDAIDGAGDVYVRDFFAKRFEIVKYVDGKGTQAEVEVWISTFDKPESAYGLYAYRAVANRDPDPDAAAQSGRRAWKALKVSGESVLGNFVMDTVRAAAGAHAALSTASSFRAAIPPGAVTVEDYLTTLPYQNVVLVHELSGAQLQALLDLSAQRRGSDAFSQVSGVRFAIRDGRAADVQVLRDPANPATGFAPLDPSATYQVATTDFQARIAAGYSDLFKAAASVRDTGLVVNDLLMATIRAESPVRAELDGRIR